MMKYTSEENSRISALLYAFESFLADNPHFDILHSEKHGYILLQYDKIEARAEYIISSDHLFFRLLTELTSDVRDLFLCGEHMNVELFPAEIEESRKRLLPYLSRLPEPLRDYYTAKAEDYFLHCN